jgi:transposase-like protein
MPKQRRTYSQEFKQDAIDLYRSSGKSRAEIRYVSIKVRHMEQTN